MEGIIGVERSPLYVNPVRDSVYADEGIYGMACRVVDEEGQFYQVEMEYGYRGYLFKGDFEPIATALWQEARNALVISPSADVLPAPTYKGTPLMTLPRGAYVIVKGGSPVPGWEEIELANGIRGYMRAEWLRWMCTLTGRSVAEQRQAIAEDAKKYLRTIYKWGGKTPQGIDCSGLTFMAYWLNGLSIYRDAKIVEGFAIYESDLARIQISDLLFYEGHVALYLGGGFFIHSKGGMGGVVIHSLDPESTLYSTLNNQPLVAVGTYFKGGGTAYADSKHLSRGIKSAPHHTV